MKCLVSSRGEMKKDPQVSGDSKEDILGQVTYYLNRAFAEDDKTVLHGQLKEPVALYTSIFSPHA